MNKQEVYEYLNSHDIGYEVTEHEAVYNMAELAEIALPHPEAIAKNLFLRDEKRQNYYLVTVKGEKRVDLKELKRNNGTRRLSFADEDDMREILGLTPGSVTPLGLLNDPEHRVRLLLDREFFGDSSLIGVHPNENTVTIWVRAEDLVQLLRAYGCEVCVTEI